METCPCGSDMTYAECCKPYIDGEKSAETAETVLRSRFCAYTNHEIEYLMETTHPDKRQDDDETSFKKWAKKMKWLKLSILKSDDGGGPDDNEGSIEFVADYEQKGIRKKHHELAKFKKKDDKWYFFDASTPIPETYKRPERKVGRNEPCPCGSGKKYKKCCLK